MAFYDTHLGSPAAMDFSTAVVPCDLTMDKFGQFEALRPTYMDEHKAVFFEAADIAILTERIGLDVARKDLRCIEVRQQDGFISLHVEFTDPQAKQRYASEHTPEHLHQATERLVQHAGEGFAIRDDRPLPERPGADSRGKIRTRDDIRRVRWEHAANQNESTRALYAQREGPPSAYDKDAPVRPRTLREMQHHLLGEEPPAHIQKIQYHADRGALHTREPRPLLAEKDPAARRHRLEVKRHPRVAQIPNDSEPSR